MPLPITAPFKVLEQRRGVNNNSVRLVPTGDNPTNADKLNLAGRAADFIDLVGVDNAVIQALPPGTLVSVVINLP